MARITSVIHSDGTVRDVRDLGLDTADLIGANKILGFNLYNAANALFCLGSKAYPSAEAARRGASTRKGNYFSSFAVSINERRNTVELVNGSRETPTYYRYAILVDGKFLPPSYESRNAAYRADTRGMIVKIGVKGTKVVSVSVA